MIEQGGGADGRGGGWFGSVLHKVEGGAQNGKSYCPVLRASFRCEMLKFRCEMLKLVTPKYVHRAASAAAIFVEVVNGHQCFAVGPACPGPSLDPAQSPPHAMPL